MCLTGLMPVRKVPLTDAEILLLQKPLRCFRCLQQGVPHFLKFLHINHVESVLKCEASNCMFPFRRFIYKETDSPTKRPYRLELIELPVNLGNRRVTTTPGDRPSAQPTIAPAGGERDEKPTECSGMAEKSPPPSADEMPSQKPAEEGLTDTKKQLDEPETEQTADATPARVPDRIGVAEVAEMPEFAADTKSDELPSQKPAQEGRTETEVQLTSPAETLQQPEQSTTERTADETPTIVQDGIAGVASETIDCQPMEMADEKVVPPAETEPRPTSPAETRPQPEQSTTQQTADETPTMASDGIVCAGVPAALELAAETRDDQPREEESLELAATSQDCQPMEVEPPAPTATDELPPAEQLANENADDTIGDTSWIDSIDIDLNSCMEFFDFNLDLLNEPESVQPQAELPLGPPDVGAATPSSSSAWNSEAEPETADDDDDSWLDDLVCSELEPSAKTATIPVCTSQQPPQPGPAAAAVATAGPARLSRCFSHVRRAAKRDQRAPSSAPMSPPHSDYDSALSSGASRASGSRCASPSAVSLASTSTCSDWRARAPSTQRDRETGSKDEQIRQLFARKNRIDLHQFIGELRKLKGHSGTGSGASSSTSSRSSSCSTVASPARREEVKWTAKRRQKGAPAQPIARPKICFVTEKVAEVPRAEMPAAVPAEMPAAVPAEMPAAVMAAVPAAIPAVVPVLQFVVNVLPDGGQYSLDVVPSTDEAQPEQEPSSVVSSVEPNRSASNDDEMGEQLQPAASSVEQKLSTAIQKPSIDRETHSSPDLKAEQPKLAANRSRRPLRRSARQNREQQTPKLGPDDFLGFTKRETRLETRRMQLLRQLLL